MTKNELWTGCVADFVRWMGEESWGWEPDFRALDLGRKKSRVWEPIFHALDPKNGKSRVREPIFHALDPSMRKRSLHNAKNKSWSVWEKENAAPDLEGRKSGPRAHFSRAGSEHERKKFA